MLARSLERKGFCVIEMHAIPSTSLDRFDAVAVVVVDTRGFRTRVDIATPYVFRVSFDDGGRLASLNALTQTELETVVVRTLSQQTEAVWIAKRPETISNDDMGRLRILVVEDDDLLRAALKRALVGEATALGVIVDLQTARTFGEALEVIDRYAIDVFLIDVCLGDVDDRSGLEFLRVVRARNIVAPAYVLTGLQDYSIEARADELAARYVPKENVNIPSLVRRIVERSAAPSDLFRSHESSVRLKQVSLDDAAAYLAKAPGGLRQAYLVARKSAVLKVLAENGGNRTAAAKALGMTRQQVQEILREDRDDLPRKAR